jgi:hypothetical protein
MYSQGQASALQHPKALAQQQAEGPADESAGHRGTALVPQQHTSAKEYHKYRIDKNGYG